MSSKSFWVDLKNVELVRTPRTILREQAKYLTEGTDSLLIGCVDDLTIGSTFRYSLDVRVPSLNNYETTILSVNHSLDLYPVHLTAMRPHTDVSCANQEELERAIESVLSSTEVKVMISRLISQLR